MGNHYVLVCGGRDFDDRASMDDVIKVLAWFYGPQLRIMHGDAPGADRMAGEIAGEFDVPVKTFPADWKRWGKEAGPMRNREMADYLEMCEKKRHTIEVIAFRGGSGTEHMVAEAERRAIHVTRIP